MRPPECSGDLVRCFSCGGSLGRLALGSIGSARNTHVAAVCVVRTAGIADALPPTAVDYEINIYSDTDITVKNNTVNSLQMTSDSSGTFDGNIVDSSADMASVANFSITNNEGATLGLHLPARFLTYF